MPWCEAGNRLKLGLRMSGALARLRDEKGVAALEFAIVGSVFLFVVLFVIDLGLQQFTQATMDAATQAAARQIQIGTYRSNDPSAMVSSICTRLSVLAPSCTTTLPSSANLSVYAVSSTQFSGLTRATPPFASSFSPGGSRSYVLLQVAYKRPQLIPTGFAEPYLMSSVIFENEP